MPSRAQTADPRRIAQPPPAAVRVAGDAAARRQLALEGVLAIAMLVYLRCLGNGFVFDDHEMIVLNRYIGQWSFLWRSLVNDSWWFRDPLHLPQSSYYRPLQDIWLGIHYQLFGLVPGGWHATMVVLHLLATWLVFKIAERLMQDWRAALLASGLFALMPIHAEAVVWPAAIPLPLSATLELAAFYLLITRGARRDLLAAMALYAAALFTHESAVVFPGLVAAYAWMLETPSTSLASDGIPARLRSTAVAIAPFAAEMLGYLIVRYAVLGFINRPNPVNHATLAQVLMTVPSAAAVYLGLLAMPWFAGPSHRLIFVTSASSPQFWLPLAGAAAIAAAWRALERSAPRWWQTRRRFYLFCAAWMVIAIAPMMNLGGLFQQGLIQDRYLYLASVGWCLMLADLVSRFAERGEGQRRAAYAAAGIVLLLYAGALWQVQGFWHDEVALFSRCIEEFPESAIWHNRLGMALEERGDLAGAQRELTAAMTLDPDDGATLYDLGLLEARLGRPAEGARRLAQGLKLLPHPPAGAYVVLAQVYEAGGDTAASEAALKLAESLPGGIEAAGLARANLKLQHGDAAGAEQLLRDLVARFPNSSEVWAALGDALTARNRYDDALVSFERAQALSPLDPEVHLRIAKTLHLMGRDEEALYECRAVMNLDPGNSGARALMAQITRFAARD